MKLSRNGAAANYGTSSFESKTIRIAVKSSEEELQLDLLFSGSIQKGSRHNYHLSLKGDEVVRIIRALSESLDRDVGEVVSQALAGSTRDLVRLTSASAKTQ